jgi:hypothetical protein
MIINELMKSHMLLLKSYMSLLFGWDIPSGVEASDLSPLLNGTCRHRRRALFCFRQVLVCHIFYNMPSHRCGMLRLCFSRFHVFYFCLVFVDVMVSLFSMVCTFFKFLWCVFFLSLPGVLVSSSPGRPCSPVVSAQDQVDIAPGVAVASPPHLSTQSARESASSIKVMNRRGIEICWHQDFQYLWILDVGRLCIFSPRAAEVSIGKNYCLRVIPTLTHHSDTVSGIPSGSMYIYIGNIYIFI